MKKITIICSVLLFTVLTSCNKETEEDFTNAESSLNILDEKRESGQIPKSVNFQQRLYAVSGNIVAHVDLLKEYKSSYQGTDYYNNLFELTSFHLFASKDFKDLDVNDLTFLLDEMRSLESNMVNIENLPKLLNPLLKKKAISLDQFYTIAKELIKKNRAELLALNWSNPDLKKEQIEELERVESNLLYARSKYHLKN